MEIQYCVLVKTKLFAHSHLRGQLEKWGLNVIFAKPV